MRSRLNFGLSLAIDFDRFLVDEMIAADDQRFQRRSYEEMFVKRADRAGSVLASHMPDIIRAVEASRLCWTEGPVKIFEDLELATAIYNGLWQAVEKGLRIIEPGLGSGTVARTRYGGFRRRFAV